MSAGMALQLELCLPRLLSSPTPGGLDRRRAGFQPESWPQGQTGKSTPFFARRRFSPIVVSERLVIEGPGTNEGLHERVAQTRYAVRQRAGRLARLELRDNRVETSDGQKFPEQRVTLVPGDLDDLSRNADLYSGSKGERRAVADGGERGAEVVVVRRPRARRRSAARCALRRRRRGGRSRRCRNVRHFQQERRRRSAAGM